MDIEHLTKTQIVMLTLLVSFVTSIATGIVTVSLMDQAPPTVAQTVNRVIEHTVQTIVATSTRGQSAAAVVTQEKTVVVSDADQVAGAVKRAGPSLVRIYSDAETPAFLALGIVANSSGTIATDASALPDGAHVIVVRSDGVRMSAFVSGAPRSGVSLLAIAPSTTKVAWTPASFAMGQATLGESVVALSGKTVSRIAAGLVTALPEGDSQVVDTDIAADSILPGSPIIDMQGLFLGISTSESRNISARGFVPASVFIGNLAR